MTQVHAGRSSIPKLPQIEHPMSRMGGRTFEVRGESRQSGSRTLTDHLRVSQEGGIFNLNSARGESEERNARWETDELELCLREKVKGRLPELRKQFVDNADSSAHKGNLSKESLHRFLATVLGRPVAPHQLNPLLQRLGVSPQSPTLSALLSGLGMGSAPAGPTDQGNWIDPVQRKNQERTCLTAHQVAESLRSKINAGTLAVKDVLPAKLTDDGKVLVSREQFREALTRNLYFMEDTEFNKLWARLDQQQGPDSPLDTLMRGLKISSINASPSAVKKTDKSQTGRKLSTASSVCSSARSSTSTPVDDFLKAKFRTGFAAMKAAFLEEDPEQTGTVKTDSFLRILNTSGGLSLTKSFLPEFLTRCEVVPTKAGQVPYRDFLFRFQDRSIFGMTSKLLAAPKIPETIPEDVEKDEKVDNLLCQMMIMFQRDFLSLLSELHKLDTKDTGVIEPAKFRTIMEKSFGFKLTEPQFKAFLKTVPLANDGSIRYAAFLMRFDGKGLAPSLFAAENTEKTDTKNTERSLEETESLISDLLATRFKEVVHVFEEEIDQLNSNRIYKEGMCALLNSFKPSPPVSQREVDRLWCTLILDDRQALDFHEFLRHFIFNPETSCFPNAKVEPPRFGDVDVIRPSQRLTGLNTHMAQSVRSHVNYRLASLRDAFLALDTKSTGLVSHADFRQVMTNLLPNLSDAELKDYCRRFDPKSTGKVSYVECLKPFAFRRLGWRPRDTMKMIMTRREKPATDHPASLSAAGSLSEPLTQKLSKCNKKVVLGACKKMDPDHTGQIGAGQLVDLLTGSFRVALGDDEMFELMCHFDEDMSGRIDYHKFVKAAFKSAK